MFPSISLTLPRPFPMYAAFPRSEYYERVRLPPQHPLPYGWSIQSAYLVRPEPRQDHGGSLRFHNASVFERAVLSDPAAVSNHHRLYR